MKTAQIDIPRSTSRTTTPEQDRTSIGAPVEARIWALAYIISKLEYRGSAVTYISAFCAEKGIDHICHGGEELKV